MSMKANKTVIGGFVVGAVALAVIAVLVFGGGSFFSDTQTWVMYFEGSVENLKEGAPLVLKGVKIGAVTDMVLECDLKEEKFRTKVLAETYGKVAIVGGDPALEEYAASRGLSVEKVHLEFAEMLVYLALQQAVDGLGYCRSGQCRLYGVWTAEAGCISSKELPWAAARM